LKLGGGNQGGGGPGDGDPSDSDTDNGRGEEKKKKKPIPKPIGPWWYHCLEDYLQKHALKLKQFVQIGEEDNMGMLLVRLPRNGSGPGLGIGVGIGVINIMIVMTQAQNYASCVCHSGDIS
jgi:hypothetical protein